MSKYERRHAGKAYYDGPASDFHMPWWPKCYPNFKPEEFADEDGYVFILVDLVDALQAARTEYGHPFILGSATRTKAQNSRAGGARRSSHLFGEAIDIGLHNGLQPGHPRFAAYDGRKLEALLKRHGFRGIGRYQFDYDKGRRGHIHVDMRPTRPATWGSWS
jgi:hypothetical protein